ncbi:hypothetical protein CCHL11_07386 [Colletotrichum chlorophyti]|uniref:Uncharacterized protein n=1 Tax=Colletotrichum chlorophyti TaxID=708187 RepID=A0A1Q8S6C3_9PEZI|nr:hypothetical protein CCHL11_07386 [Colletotrichum chlorophyti]
MSTPTSVNGAAGAAPAHGGLSRYGHHHRSSPSLSSLYEVLADLDDNQLQYLIQEMNHTGHQNIPVTKAVSALEARNRNPSGSLNTYEAHSPPPTQEPQRQLSKSQRGKLRLQTAFRRAPSLQQRRRREADDVRDDLHPEAAGPLDTGNRRSVYSNTVDRGSHEPATTPHKREYYAADSGNLGLSNRGGGQEAPVYKRISRPDFNLPVGIDVTDLIQLLETQYISSDPRSSPSPSTLSFPSSSSPPSFFSPSPSTPALRPSPSVSSLRAGSETPEAVTNGRRPLRKQSSRLHMALDAERSASGIEQIGMSMLEPRQPWSASLSAWTPGDNRTSMGMDPFERDFRGKRPSTASDVVFEGILDVLNNQ